MHTHLCIHKDLLVGIVAFLGEPSVVRPGLRLGQPGGDDGDGVGILEARQGT